MVNNKSSRLNIKAKHSYSRTLSADLLSPATARRQRRGAAPRDPARQGSQSPAPRRPASGRPESRAGRPPHRRSPGAVGLLPTCSQPDRDLLPTRSPPDRDRVCTLGSLERRRFAGKVRTGTAGLPFTLLARPHPEWTIAAANEVKYFRKKDVGATRALAACPALSAAWRDDLLERLSSLESGRGETV